jgi:exopolyphosphatase/pppGpp-phosphohydrolase
LQDIAGRSLKKAEKFVEDAFEDLDILHDGEGRTFYAVGGTWRALARLHMWQTGYPFHVMHNYRISAREALEFSRLVHRVDTETLSKIEVVNAARRPLLAYAALVMENLVRTIKPKQVIISVLGVREGLLYSLLRPSERARDPLALERHLVRHAELKRVAAHGADHRERDTCVAARRVEHDASAAQPAFLLRVEHHPESRPILHAAARIRALDLHPEIAAQARADAMQRDEWRIADALEDRSAHALADEVGGEAGHSERLVERARPGRSPAHVARGEALRRDRRSPQRRATSDRR